MPINLSAFYKAIEALKEGRVKTLTSLPNSSKALLFALIKEPCLLICPSEDSAAETHLDVAFWSKSLSLEEPILIPPRGISSRIKNLRRLYEGSGTKFITSVEAALSPLWRKEKLPVLSITKNTSISMDNLVRSLSEMGYRRVTLVAEQGEFSLRGGILDVFSSGDDLPVRFEFFGDEIESIRLFDIDTQRTIKELEEFSIFPFSEPEDGPNLIELLTGHRLFVNEPSDIKRHFDKETINLYSLPIDGDDGEGLNLGLSPLGGLGLISGERKNIDDFIQRVKTLRSEFFMLMVCSSEGQAKRLKELLQEADISAPILSNENAVSYTGSPVITISELSKGFSFDRSIVLTGRDIFGERPVFRPTKKSRVSKLIASVEDMKEGDCIVHVDHGIGRFLGLRRQKIEYHEGDFLIIGYVDGTLYLPLERIHKVQKYHASEGAIPKFDRLGGKTWLRTKARVKKKIADMAEKLLRLYAERVTRKGHAFSMDTELHREFDGFFPYEETPDQLTAIEGIKQDMEKPEPMDRLLCGDVGYGKTEVAMRAAFKAVYDGKQVAVLVPTTILAEQHFDTFSARFSAFPVKVDYLSRFKNRAEQKETLKLLEKGDIDIIIGTHRLLGRDIKFHNLGLLIVDEEHRFGVSHKEKIKALKSNVDVLTLTATPIPRTLHMALSGIRSMSTIETPPEDRLAARSFVTRFSPEIIKEALLREFSRNGQAFFVHNRIQDIYKIADFLKRLLPEHRLLVAHGQVREKELENVMRMFVRKDADLLVSTAIIGSGLDIPSANTIIINRADKFGLADLYQLRGRVGRSNVRAYAYFLIPEEEAITTEARKKLEALQELSYLGAGFRLALKDMEIRGAGNLLGSEQSGHIDAVGFDLYIEMLERAVAELKGEELPPEIEPVLDLRVTALIPESYIEDPTLRLSLYRRIATVKNREQVREFHAEFNDRFGKPPEEVLRLLDIMEIKLMARELAITKIQNLTGRIKITFDPSTKVSPSEILSLWEGRKGYIKFLPEAELELNLIGKTWKEIMMELTRVMEELST
ncbi:MAG: transcription-repair coupling factor [Nitrospirae bacterium]|nr:transcription-repair coupling factor [Nitrospirota bacterium]